jgi:glyoxylase-like metal-dependent hydrolase (beta-lactamase superfamily II)
LIVERSMHPQWLSNAYLIAAAPGGPAAFVDSGAPLEPLIEAAVLHTLRPTHLLTTHGHSDHVAGHRELLERYDLDVLAHPADGVEAATDLEEGTVLEIGDLRVEARHTPGHSPGHLAFVADGACFTADVLFRDSVGGTRDAFDQVRTSVMDVLMQLPHETVVYPGHTDETTIGREWEQNPFVRVWRGLDPEGAEPCRVGGDDATLVVWSPDYDGNGKAWVRLADGRNVIVGGSSVERL